MKKVSIIAALAANRVIGKNGALPWAIPEDLAHFRATTLGQTVIMGRKTWESLPEKARPLSGRCNIVVSRQPGYDAGDFALTAPSLEAAIAIAPLEHEIFVIGGAELYKEAIPLASSLYLTEIGEDYEGDVLFPELDAKQWTCTLTRAQFSRSGVPLAFSIYSKVGGDRA